MRRIATLVATGAVAATTAIALTAGPASADTVRTAEPLRGGPQVSVDAVNHAWKTSGKYGISGVQAYGSWAHYTKNGKKKIKINLTVKDTNLKDGLTAALEVIHGNKVVILPLPAGTVKASGTVYYAVTKVYVREVLGYPISSTKFRVTKHAKSYKKLG
ncbi:hypothetical protein NE236_14435 [Actinoallomurus purpureus]|uniref:hypothetical protein n=1 Tax=Actinoallomurus purpureus TaxID=478114 RepID=UPI0020927E87|nr:hypothetical protein [Actinoallomurus purpureus]MCO6006187.1 hypothetical protein [Actinoallomurus purpureus]